MTSPPGKRLENPLHSPVFYRRARGPHRRTGTPCPALPAAAPAGAAHPAGVCPRSPPRPAARCHLGAEALPRLFRAHPEPGRRDRAPGRAQPAAVGSPAGRPTEEADCSAWSRRACLSSWIPPSRLEQKRQRIPEMGYNRRVAAISAASQELLALLLPARDTPASPPGRRAAGSSSAASWAGVFLAAVVPL